MLTVVHRQNRGDRAKAEMWASKMTVKGEHEGWGREEAGRAEVCCNTLSVVSTSDRMLCIESWSSLS